MGVLVRAPERPGLLVPYATGHADVSGAPVEFDERTEGCAVALRTRLLRKKADLPAILGEHSRELAREHE